MSELDLQTGCLAIYRLPADAEIPFWATGGRFFSVTRTADELSVVCSAGAGPADTPCESDWRALRVAGPLAFSLTGVLAAIAAPLAEAGVSLFAISTYDTDYILVKDACRQRAVDALRAAGHTVRT